LLVVAYGWFGTSMGPGVLAAMSGAVVLYTLFQAPMWCCAETREHTLCRNNAYGILLGCHIREHKWQKAKMAIKASSWGRFSRQVLASVGGVAASVSALASSFSAFAALGTFALK
jgi:hypothetical protein